MTEMKNFYSKISESELYFLTWVTCYPSYCNSWFAYRKIMELEEELKVVGNSLKSLEVSEEKVNTQINDVRFWYFSDSIHFIYYFSG